jgi:hypothetical protein
MVTGNSIENFFKLQYSIEIDMYRKPTTTDTTINFISNHPMEHKLAAYRYYLTRVNSLPLSKLRKQKNGISYNT